MSRSSRYSATQIPTNPTWCSIKCLLEIYIVRLVENLIQTYPKYRLELKNKPQPAKEPALLRNTAY